MKLPSSGLPHPFVIVPPKKAYFGSANGVNLSSKLISDGQVREAYSEFEDLPLAQQLTVSVTPVIGDVWPNEDGVRAWPSIKLTSAM